MRSELSNEFVKIHRYQLDDVELLFEAANESKNEMFEWMPWCHSGKQLLKKAESL